MQEMAKSASYVQNEEHKVRVNSFFKRDHECPEHNCSIEDFSKQMEPIERYVVGSNAYIDKV
jgi:hypothetical protein